MADFHERWERAGKSPAGPGRDWREAFETWTSELAELVSTHGTAGLSTGAERSLSGLAAHDPAHETITEVEVDGDRARVRSVIAVNPPATYYEYRLEGIDGEWRIARLLSFLDPPGTPLVEPAEAERLLGSADATAPLTPLPPDLDVDPPRLFAEGLSVVRLGEIRCGSGVLAVRDLGVGVYDLEPLARRIPVGSYAVDVSSAGGTNLAARMVLSDAPTIGWHLAETRAGTHAVGVDTGSVAIVDLATLAGCESQHFEEVFGHEGERLGGTPGTVFRLGDAGPDTAVVPSGDGDGVYPCYWGVAADGTLTALVIDFQVLSAAGQQEITPDRRPAG